jgi:hypothetical protein
VAANEHAEGCVMVAYFLTDYALEAGGCSTCSDLTPDRDGRSNDFVTPR